MNSFNNWFEKRKNSIKPSSSTDDLSVRVDKSEFKLEKGGRMETQTPRLQDELVKTAQETRVPPRWIPRTGLEIEAALRHQRMLERKASERLRELTVHTNDKSDDGWTGIEIEAALRYKKKRENSIKTASSQTARITKEYQRTRLSRNGGQLKDHEVELPRNDKCEDGRDEREEEAADGIGEADLEMKAMKRPRHV